MFKHTDETDKVIRSGYAANKRILDIATALGVSRNVVIGRARRIGLSNPENMGSARSTGWYSEVLSEAAKKKWKKAPQEERKRTGARLKAGRERWLEEYREFMRSSGFKQYLSKKREQK